MSNTKAIAFFGASGGCGLSALKHALAEGHTCIALCRSPSKLTDQFPADKYPNLSVIEGNAHDVAAVSKCIVQPSDPLKIVDHILSSIGGVFQPSKLTIDDPHVCERGMEALLQALANVRANGATGRPHISALSTTGISKAGRDLPLAMDLFYRMVISVPHKDKRAMEDLVVSSREDFTIVRPSLLVADKEHEDWDIRVGIEDLMGGKNIVERKEWGYTISRADVGKWIYQNLIKEDEGRQYVGKATSLTW
ncbi:NAD(P)-binding protein [Truncatella angustata]|uniref:NAD(P)-binding protein n=1 Tax=Truncatella angustata TaxID=152316 RepID=A0A9P9A4A9_9PEZI|nr:NAD(P)-binding protein [Truncatella angustata]KAH6661337.1 NAD(P)-binding protein [Truncatella angustata]KAH8202185.1 hypothetical protein TruAng_003660 [Truncatella angustata]